MKKTFEAYPRRQIRLSEEVWLELKKEKEKFGKNWNSFIKSLLVLKAQSNILKKEDTQNG